MKMASTSWNDLSLEMSLTVTNNDLFDGLLFIGAIPTDHCYRNRVYEWIKWNVLEKSNPSCQEEEWLLEYTNSFCYHISSLWMENKGIIIQNDAFFKKVIKPNENPEHSCLKCSPSMPRRNKKIMLIPNQVRK